MRNQYLTQLLLIVCLLSCTLWLQAQEVTPASTLHIPSHFDTISLPSIQWIYKEGAEALSIEDVTAGHFKDASLLDLSDGQKHFATAHRAFWFKVRLTSDAAVLPFGLAVSSQGRCWPFEPTYKTLDSWQITPNGYVKGYSGTAATYSQRDYPQHLYPTMIKVDMKREGSVDIWCRVVRAMGCEIQTNLQLYAYTITNQAKIELEELFWHNLLRGASIALLLVGLLFYFWYREPVFLWFTILQVVMIFSRLLDDLAPDLYLHFFRENPRIINFWMGLFAGMSIAVLLHFACLFINTKERYPRIHKLLVFSTWMFIIYGLIGTVLRFMPSLPSEWWHGFNRVSLGLVFLGVVMTMIYFLLSKDKLARAFSLGAIAPFFVLLWQIVAFLFGKPKLVHIEVIFTAGYVLSMTMALVYRFRSVMQERENAIQEKLKAQLNSSQQALKSEISTKFFANITHEFRTPLTLILEPVRQMLFAKPNHPDAERLKLVKGNSEKLLSLVNQLLDLSKIEQNQMQLDLQFNDIHTIVRPIFNSFKILADKKGIQLRLKGHQKISGSLIDQAKVERIIFNLLSNAIKFTNEGRVELHLEEKNQRLIMTVKDTGIGIATSDLPYIFDRFHQVDGSNTRKNEGSGIGLSLVKELVTLMEGELTVDSEVGKGTNFTVILPMTGIAAATKAAATPKEPSFIVPTIPTILINRTDEADTEKPIVLIVEDNHELRAFVRQSLDVSYQIIEASNGQEGIDKAKQLIPDLIVSDVMMPEKDGLQLTAELKQAELTSHIPIILLTAKSKVDSKIAGLSIGADAYLTKPFNTQELLIRIQKLIELRTLLQAKYSQQLNIQNSLPASPSVEDKAVVTLSQIDNEFLRKFHRLLHKEMSNADLSIEDLAKRVFMSRSQLFRKVKALTGQSPTDFMRCFRLDQAHQLLKDQQHSIAEICELVGFRTEKYFVTRFKERFGVSPRKF